MANDIIYNKIEIIERCLGRIEEVYGSNSKNLEDYTKQDSIILNIQRACEAVIDLAMHIVSVRRLGIPQNSRDTFEMMLKYEIINEDVCKKLKAMVGFRDIVLHNYEVIELAVIQQVIENHLGDFIEFVNVIQK